MRVLDLFSGIGGFSLGLERAGMETVAFCEINPFCRKVLKKHWPDVPIFEDVQNLKYFRSKQRLCEKPAHPKIPEEVYGAIDVVCGGFPCQDISVAGKGAGIAGERSGLWKEFSRIIGEVRPRYAILENTSALLGRGVDVVLGDLSALGFDAEWHCVPACAVGAPHQRDRVWIIAHTPGEGLEGRLKPQTTRQTQRQFAGRYVRVGTSWPDAPCIPRVGYGLSDWSHRIKSIGNAVVPQVVEVIGRAIMAVEQ